MENIFEYKTCFNNVTFHLTNKSAVDEREIHSYHEILLYVDGDAEFMSTDGQRRIKSGSVLLIPRETYHFFRFNENFTRLKISFRNSDFLPMEEKGIRVFENLNKNTAHAFERLCAVIKENCGKKGFYVYSAFLMLMTEIDLSGHETKDLNKVPSPLMTTLADYISDNLSCDLSIKTLSDNFHVSPSSITHQFKTEFGIPLHKFIMQKRMIAAKRMLADGKLLSKAYSDLGFSDYSSLYKAYVKFFGVSPSEDKIK